MDEEKKKRKKKAADAGDGGHKKPWQETYATPEEIKAMLDRKVSLRYNEVRGRTEIHWLSAGPVIKADEQHLKKFRNGINLRHGSVIPAREQKIRAQKFGNAVDGPAGRTGFQREGDQILPVFDLIIRQRKKPSLIQVFVKIHRVINENIQIIGRIMSVTAPIGEFQRDIRMSRTPFIPDRFPKTFLIRHRFIKRDPQRQRIPCRNG